MLVGYGEGDLEADHLRRITDTLIDSSISASDLLEVVRSNGNLGETRWVVKKQNDVPGLDNDIVWIERGVPGDDGTGWRHIDDKHTSDLVNKYESIDSSDGVESLVNSIIRNPDRVTTTSDGKAVFVYKVESDKKPVTVYVGSNGFTQTAYPQNLP
ncbi:hypothetical protein [Halopiger aswanensis]|uniref:Uncharacterized protein n=1 Tax=Halopiger aswanensis TaxID=148449 RepID=A0A419WE06_9EURY|nr:hypothetical protein [Halopiger aswanensis]RKD93700.1 hypothetical protein ATJ93_3332 [Halopiger aswanensis]